VYVKIDIGKNLRTQQKLFIISYTILLFVIKNNSIRRVFPISINFKYYSYTKYNCAQR
jgi:hypothetical protein